MEPWQIALLVVGCVVLFILLVLIGFTFFAHRWMFNHRFKPEDAQIEFIKKYSDLNEKEVSFDLEGVTLRGVLYNFGEYDPNKIVVFCHGMWSSQRSYIHIISYLAHKGYQVLGFDYEGVDSSDGKAIRGFGNSLRCADYAIRFVKEHEETKGRDIYVVGHSWGGFATSNIAGIHKDIKGVVPISAVIGVAHLMKGLLPKPLRWLAYVFQVVDSLKCGKYSYYNAIKSLKDYEGKVLFIHSKDDEVVKIGFSTEYVQKHSKNSNIQYLILEGKKHQPHFTKESAGVIYEYNQMLKTLSKEEQDKIKNERNFLELAVVDPETLDKIVELIVK